MSLEDWEIEDFLLEELPKIKDIDSYENFINFCENIENQTGDDRPVSVSIREKEINSDLINELLQLGYPNDFIDWHQKHGNVYLWLESTKIIETESVIKEVNNNFWNLLTKNDYLILTTDGSGNAYVINKKVDSPEIIFVRYDDFFRIESIYLIYEEHYDFSIDNKFYNGEIDINKVINDNGEYIINSEYVLKYFSDVFKPTGHSDFLSFMKDKIDEGIRDRWSL